MKLDVGKVLQAGVLDDVSWEKWTTVGLTSCFGQTVASVLVGKWMGGYLITTGPLFYFSLQWYPLQSGQGQVHLRLEWLSLLPDAEKLEQVSHMGRSKNRDWEDQGLTSLPPARFYSGIGESPLNQSLLQLPS